jgi:hypothetical protein
MSVFPKAVVYLKSTGEPRAVEIEGFTIPFVTAFNYGYKVDEFGMLTVTFAVSRCETLIDKPEPEKPKELEWP